MSETLTPNSLSIHKQIPKMITSPTSPFFLGSNDDQLERAAARAARAAAFRRKPIEARVDLRHSLAPDSCLDRRQIIELFQNCVKLATENKINQKNTWELKLIDHISEIIKVETEENNAETNFQKAGCTLETGVKIYATRVDAWHADAYRVMSGISRAGLEDEKGENVYSCFGCIFHYEKRCYLVVVQISYHAPNKNSFRCNVFLTDHLPDIVVDWHLTNISIVWDRTRKEKDGGRRIKEIEQKVSPLATVEPSFEALNVKKFDVTCAVDPLYYQTSAQFDEGGAKGLLLYNLGVYGGCRVLFDSQENPANCISPTNVSTSSDLVDVSFAKGCIELMVANSDQKQDISPSLRDLLMQSDKFDLPSRVLDGMESILIANENDANNVELNVGKEFFGTGDATKDIGVQLNDGACDDIEACCADLYDYPTVSGADFNEDISTMQNFNEEPMQFIPDEPVVIGSSENVAWLFCKELGYKSACNAWAGPDHWTYSKPNGPESISARDRRSNCAVKEPKSKCSLEFDIDFTRNLDGEVLNVCAPAKNSKSLLLPPRKVSCTNKLPEDCHYQPEDLVKLFLLPNVMCLGKIRRRLSGLDPSLPGGDVDESFPSWENSTIDDPCENDYIQRDAEVDILVSEPRRVGKIEVEYDKTSKHFDVHVLKETLWTLMERSFEIPEVKIGAAAASFRSILTAIPGDCKAADTTEISPHLCFICLLHLANEHRLSIVGCPNLDDLSIQRSVACEETVEVITASS